MISGFQTFILWGIGIIAISAITIFILYRLAYMIAILILLLGIGFLIGTPLVLIYKAKYKKLIKQLKEVDNN